MKKNIFILLHVVGCFFWIFLTPNFSYSQEKIFDLSEDAQDIVIYGSDTYDGFGSNVVSGDVNGDGRDDLIISAESAGGPDNTRPNCGEVYIIYGENLDTAIDIKNQADLIIYGAQMGNNVGYALECGDINGDNKDDIIIGTYQVQGPTNFHSQGTVYIIYGSDKWEKGQIIDLNDPKQIDLTIYGKWDDRLGSGVAIGDIDGDNKDDLIIGACSGDGPGGRSRCGKVYVIYGKNNFSANYVMDLTTSPPPDITIYGADAYDGMGWDIAGADINGDEIDDIIIGVSQSDGPNNSRWKCGEVYVLYGRKDFPSNYSVVVNTSTVDLTIYGADSNDNLGSNLIAGDINDDNLDDLILGVANASGPDNTRFNSGKVYIIHGKSDFGSKIIDLSAGLPEITIYGADLNDYLGSNLIAGDINGDNLDDLIITARGDGPYNHWRDCGEVYAIYGGRLNTTIDLANNSYNLIIYGASKYDLIGTGLTIGDLNGDSINDLVIGASSALGKNQEQTGEVYIIYGWRPLESPQISINTLDNLIVTLNLGVGGDPTEMFISGDITDSFKDTWIPYATSINAALTGSEGTKTVTAKFRNALGRESAECSDTITIDVSENKISVITNTLNPRKGETAIFSYSITNGCRVKIEVYNLAGEMVRRLMDEERPAEIGTIIWDGRNDYGKIAADGVYLLSLEAGSFKKTEKILLEK